MVLRLSLTFSLCFCPDFCHLNSTYTQKKLLFRQLTPKNRLRLIKRAPKSKSVAFRQVNSCFAMWINVTFSTHLKSRKKQQQQKTLKKNPNKIVFLCFCDLSKLNTHRKKTRSSNCVRVWSNSNNNEKKTNVE